QAEKKINAPLTQTRRKKKAFTAVTPGAGTSVWIVQRCKLLSSLCEVDRDISWVVDRRGGEADRTISWSTVVCT
ncbi:hypothetical protein BaRGS_00023663, partial [Batillaria attramentaria]